MFSAIFQHHYGYLALCCLTALVIGGATWLLARRSGSPFGLWWGASTATLTGVFGVTFMGSGAASAQCVINHNLAEPFHTTQGLWNLAMTVPLGFFALLAVRRFVPVLVGVVALPLAIEFVQATVDGLGRVCDSSDAEMNILGGLAGIAIASAALLRRDALNWKSGAQWSLATAAALLVLGAGVARPMVAFVNVDGTGLSAADTDQQRAVRQAVTVAFGDHYRIGNLYEQPCPGSSCTSIAFHLLSRDTKHPEAYSTGTLSWPDKQHLNVLLVDSTLPSVMGYPVDNAAKASTQQEAYQIAQQYVHEHYPWASDAFAHKTSQVGGDAKLGWITSYRWVHNDVLMPRMLDIQVSRAGQISQVDVTLGPKKIDLPPAKLDAQQAEAAVLDGLVTQAKTNHSVGMTKDRLRDLYDLDAFTLKAAQRDGTWRSEWLVNVTHKANSESAAGSPDMWRVDSASGQVYDGVNLPVKTN